MNVRVPSKITNGITAFCKTINPNSKPSYVQIVPIEGALVNECFSNVDKKIAQSGGEKVYGWSIWQWKGVFLEAELHAIWRSSKGGLLDVSPPSDTKEKKKLFLPDPNISFHNRRVNNIRKALRNESIIQDYFNVFDERLALMEKYSLPGEFGPVSIPKNEANQIMIKMSRLEQQLLQLPPINPNQLCFCGSGKKYKHCCL